MKKLTDFFEHCVTSDVNPGNSMDLGVANHYTPIQNIVTNVRNLFCTLPIFVAVAEDGVSMKLHSTKAVSKEEIEQLLDTVSMSTTLRMYITQQGLDKFEYVNLGQYWVLYCSPSDVKSAKPGLEATPSQLPQTGTKENTKVETNKNDVKVKEAISLSEDDEIISEAKADDDDEMEDLTKGKLREIFKMEDKVKAAKQLELLVGQEMELPKEFYFAGVTSRGNGENSIALRWKYTKRGGHDSTVEIVKSLINFYDTAKDGVFVPDFDPDSMFQLPDEVKKLIENVLKFVGAEKTDDPCVYSMENLAGDSEGADKKDDKGEGADKKDDKGDDLLSGDKKDDKGSGASTDLLA